MVQVKLAGDGSQAAARLVKARLERTQLGQVCKHIKAVLQPGHAHVAVRLDMRHISKLSLDVTAMDVKSRIMEHPKLKFKDVNSVRCGQCFNQRPYTARQNTSNRHAIVCCAVHEYGCGCEKGLSKNLSQSAGGPSGTELHPVARLSVHFLLLPSRHLKASDSVLPDENGTWCGSCPTSGVLHSRAC